MARLIAIETARLRMRPYVEADLEALHRLWTDAQVRRFLWDDTVIARGAAAEAMRASIACTQAHGFGHWALARRDAAALIGFCGLKHMAEPSEVELMYGLLPAHWGAGLITEAAAAWIHVAFTRLALPRVWALTDAPNTRSEAVMRRLGMRFVERAPYHGLDCVRYVIEPADGAAAPGGLRLIEAV